MSSPTEPLSGFPAGCRSLAKDDHLQNLGNPGFHAGHDTTIQDPSGCGPYEVWGGAKFGEASPYLLHFTKPINWAPD